MSTILAIDPGREKCGLAVVSQAGVLHHEVVAREMLVETAAALTELHSVDRIIVGAGTAGRQVLRAIVERISAIPVELVDETLSSRRARNRFFEENPPRGLRRLIPRGLLTPSRPYDDYAAIILGEDHLNRA